jgi:excisionase family DNA binding protein
MSDQVSGDIKDLEKIYGIKERTARHLVATKAIPFIKIGRLVRFRFADIDQWLTDNTTQPSGEHK